MNKVAVIGAGIAGIATAIRLSLKGYQVSIFEKNTYPGGKLSAFEIQGYRFDAGPSLFTMPHFVTELFDKAGVPSQDFFQYSKKEIACCYFWEDGTRFSAHSNRELFLNEVESVFKEPKSKVENYLLRAKKKYDLTAPLFLNKSLHKTKTYFSVETLQALLRLPIYELEKTLHQANQKAFSSPHLIQLFDRYATYNGSNPYQTSGMMTLIQHLEGNYGTFIPKGGMIAITNALVALAERLGVIFNYSTSVEEIIVSKGKAIAVRTINETYPAAFVVSNMDVFYTYTKLLPNQKAPLKVLKQERSSAAVIFYWGIKQTFPELDLHNIFFSSNYKQEFAAIFDEKTICDDPTIYVNITSKDVSDDAPQGCENWFVMINTPADHGQDWKSELHRLRAIVIAKLSRVLKVDLSNHIACEEVLTPPMIQEKTQSYLGALYGASSNTVFSAFLRHPNFSNRIKNLYFCGGSAHPGGGIPLCLLSAKIIDEMLPEYTS